LGDAISPKIINQVITKHFDLAKNHNFAFLKSVISDPLVYDAFFLHGGIWRALASTVLQVIFISAFLCSCWYYLGSSPGKILVGTKIVDANTFGKITLRQVLVRISVCVFTTPFNILSMLTNRKLQAWHDKSANTVVIKR
jgi:uncharacterized RDD family membrane protein YckC